MRGVPVWATLLALERDGQARGRGRLGAGARPALVGRPRRGRLGRRRADPRLRGRQNRGRGHLDRRPVRPARRAGRRSPRAPGRAAASATSGSTASSPKVPSTLPRRRPAALGLRRGPAPRRGGGRPLLDLRRRAPATEGALHGEQRRPPRRHHRRAGLIRAGAKPPGLARVETSGSARAPLRDIFRP